MDERIRFVIRLKDGESMAALCREFQISRKTGYKIFERYDSRFDLLGQLVCISVGAPGPIREPLQSAFLM